MRPILLLTLCSTLTIHTMHQPSTQDLQKREKELARQCDELTKRIEQGEADETEHAIWEVTEQILRDVRYLLRHLSQAHANQ